MHKTIRVQGVILILALGAAAGILLLIPAPRAVGCTFAAIKSVILAADPPRPVAGKPFTLNAVLLYGGGMGHGNMLTAAENAVSTTLTLPQGMRITKGDNPLQTTTPVFCLGYETTVVLSWEVVADKAGPQRVRIDTANTTWGQGQESSATDSENGLLAWEVVRPSMKDTRIESGDKDAIDEQSLARMPSLRLKQWEVLPNGDISFTNADGTRYSAPKSELDLSENAPSPVLVSDVRGNKYLTSNGYILVADGPEVFAPTSLPAQPGPNDPVTVQAKIIGTVDKGKASLVYSADGITWKPVEMAPVAGESTWKAEIPAQGPETTALDYYLQVADNAGRQVATPRYGVRIIPKETVAEGVRNVVLLTLAHILAAIVIIVLWAKWDLGRRTRQIKSRGVILGGDQPSLYAQRMTGILEQVRRPVAAGAEGWLIGFYVLVALGLFFTIMAVLTNQFSIVNLIIRMG